MLIFYFIIWFKQSTFWVNQRAPKPVREKQSAVPRSVGADCFQLYANEAVISELSVSLSSLKVYEFLHIFLWLFCFKWSQTSLITLLKASVYFCQCLYSPYDPVIFSFILSKPFFFCLLGLIFTSCSNFDEKVGRSVLPDNTVSSVNIHLNMDDKTRSKYKLLWCTQCPFMWNNKLKKFCITLWALLPNWMNFLLSSLFNHNVISPLHIS